MTNKTIILASAAAVMASTMAAGPVVAQEINAPNYVDAWHQSYIMTRPLHNGDDDDSETGAADTIFVRLSSVTRQVTESFFEANNITDPNRRAAFAAYLADGGPFEQQMTAVGFDSRNLADVIAAYQIAMWQIVNDRKISSGQGAAIQAQVREDFAARADIRKMGQVRKQQSADSYALLMVMRVDDHDRLKARGDAALAQYRETIYSEVLRDGVDLRRLTVTDQGFASR